MRFAAAIVFALLPGAALAQEVPEATAMDLWCGLAFGIVSSDAPVDVTSEQRGVIDAYRRGGEELVNRAKAAHLERGYSEQTFGSRVETLTAEINATFNGAAQVNAGGNATPYTFEACSALIGL